MAAQLTSERRCRSQSSCRVRLWSCCATCISGIVVPGARQRLDAGASFMEVECIQNISESESETGPATSALGKDTHGI